MRLHARLMVSVATLLCGALTGCVAVGYSSQTGWHMFPGPLALLVAVLVVVFLLRRRR